MGTNPFRKKPQYSEDEKCRRAERLRNAQKNEAPAGAVNSGAGAEIQNSPTRNERILDNTDST
jgi:hypothetical protein